jgi:hypothetical protein
MKFGFVHLLYNISWEFHQLAAGQLLLATGPVRDRQALRPVHHIEKSHRPVHSPPASQAGRRVGPALYSLQPQWKYLPSSLFIATFPTPCMMTLPGQEDPPCDVKFQSPPSPHVWLSLSVQRGGKLSLEISWVGGEWGMGGRGGLMDPSFSSGTPIKQKKLINCHTCPSINRTGYF